MEPYSTTSVKSHTPQRQQGNHTRQRHQGIIQPTVSWESFSTVSAVLAKVNGYFITWTLYGFYFDLDLLRHIFTALKGTGLRTFIRRTRYVQYI